MKLTNQLVHRTCLVGLALSLPIAFVMCRSLVRACKRTCLRCERSHWYKLDPMGPTIQKTQKSIVIEIVCFFMFIIFAVSFGCRRPQDAARLLSPQRLCGFCSQWFRHGPHSHSHRADILRILFHEVPAAVFSYLQLISQCPMQLQILEARPCRT